ncbi:TRASH domain-containing protein [Sulfolobus acidocaldarius]|uniref:Conserved protein n=3 Tax=Sulfolobus acidocaldarius TaxID=2285 RepID=Q4J867_SULAC|nr:TRASH domain-containing protein [Sulfolobus acidocaldarius]AAY81015.1 conserved protein [Sulfolobus acidocaldarius DSM 639]AGE71620.1 hypothetical protein SacN8_08300 [Sulfolobus acidocaldarius N8]AGE73894.1 hypothetical protein SacRon12I_08315 [Sulfolobus acidocaldarius Ron12/I]WCM35524.1 TRASH domain-containing protein [Sulfolobus acidocaldarius DSM 639]
MVKIRMNKNELKCENCGMELTEEHIYTRMIKGKEHYFCCADCSNEFERKFNF